VALSLLGDGVDVEGGEGLGGGMYLWMWWGVGMVTVAMGAAISSAIVCEGALPCRGLDSVDVVRLFGLLGEVTLYSCAAEVTLLRSMTF